MNWKVQLKKLKTNSQRQQSTIGEMGWFKMLAKGIGKALVKFGIKSAVAPLALAVDVVDVAVDVFTGNEASAALGAAALVGDLVTLGTASAASEIARVAGEELGAQAVLPMLQQVVAQTFPRAAVSLTTLQLTAVATTAAELARS